jgi:hypothetical protein
VAQVYLLGLCLVYLRVTEGLDLSATEAALRQKLDEARNRASDLGEKARAAAQRTAAPSPTPPAGMQAPSYTPPTPMQPPYNPAGVAAGGAAAAFATAPSPTAVPPAYTPPSAYTPPTPPAASTDIDLSFDDSPPTPVTPPAATPAYSPPAYSPPAYVPPPAQPAAAPAMPAASTCPQCLSPVTGGRLLRCLRLPPEMSRPRRPDQT